MQSNSTVFTSGLIDEAANIIRPGFEDLIRRRDRRIAAAIAVLDPVVTSRGYDEKVPLPVIWTGVFGEHDKRKWAAPYDEFVRYKARNTWKHGMPGHLAALEPWLYEKGDFKFPGAEKRGQLIVATSGLEWQDDFAISASLAAICHGLSLRWFGAEFARKPYFIGHEDFLSAPAQAPDVISNA